MGVAPAASAPTPRLFGDPFPYNKPGQMLAIFKEQAFLVSSYLHRVIWFLSTEVSGEPDDWGGVPGLEQSFCAMNGGSVCGQHQRGGMADRGSLWLLGLELKCDLFPSQYAPGGPPLLSFSSGSWPPAPSVPVPKWETNTRQPSPLTQGSALSSLISATFHTREACGAWTVGGRHSWTEFVQIALKKTFEMCPPSKQGWGGVG